MISDTNLESIEEIPVPLLKHLIPLKRKTKSPSSILYGLPEGKRDDTLFRYLCSLRRKDVGLSNAIMQALEIAKNCEPPFSMQEALKKVEQAYGYLPGSGGDTQFNAPIEDAILEIREFQKLKIGERQSYLHPWCKEDAIILISGYRGIGKTFFGLGVLDAVSNFKQFGPWPCNKSVPCLLLDGEMPPADIQDRSISLGLYCERKNNLYIYCDAHAHRLGLPRANLTDYKWRSKMAEILSELEIKLWIIDNLASLAPGLDENSRQDWDPINQWLLELRFAGITTIMLHHVGKGGSQRGTSAREDNLDTSILLKPPSDYSIKDGARFIVNFSKTRVKSSDLNLVVDAELQLLQNDFGQGVWTHGVLKQETRKRILTLLGQGMTQIEVSRELNVSKGHVCKVRKKAIQEGKLTEDNELVQGNLF